MIILSKINKKKFYINTEKKKLIKINFINYIIIISTIILYI